MQDLKLLFKIRECNDTENITDTHRITHFKDSWRLLSPRAGHRNCPKNVVDCRNLLTWPFIGKLLRSHFWFYHVWGEMHFQIFFSKKPPSLIIQAHQHHFRFWSVSSAKPDDIFWNKFEQTLFSLVKWTTLLQIFSHSHLIFWENGCNWCRLLKSTVQRNCSPYFKFTNMNQESRIN
jgi:hypothetical protein